MHNPDSPPTPTPDAPEEANADDGFGAPARYPAPPPTEFYPSWLSLRGLMVILLVLPLGFFVMGASLFGQAGVVIFGLCAALVAWMMWALSRPLRDKSPLIAMDVGGITVRGHPTILWSEITDVFNESAQGNVQLVLAMAPRPGGDQHQVTRIPLATLGGKQHAQVLQTAFQFFASHSGAKAEAAMRAHAQEDAAAAAFDRTLAERTPRIWGMWLVMGLCAAVWAATGVAGMSLMEPRADDLYRWGANSASGVQAGQWWRLLTAMFLHGGFMHLALNMYALLQAGILVTQLFGNAGFLVAYLGAGLVGNALSLHFSAQTGVSVGASGAVFGVAGALLAAVIQHRGKFPLGRPKQLLYSLGIFIFYSLAYGFKDGIDNAAHVGGLLAGFACGWFLVDKLDDTATPRRRAVTLAAVLAMCLAATTALVATTPPAQRDTAAYYEDIKTFNTLKPRLDGALAAFNADLTLNKEGKLDADAFIARIDSVHVPALRAVGADYARLRLPADERVGRYAAAYARFAAAAAAQMDADVERARTPSAEAEAHKRQVAAELAQARAAIGELNAQSANSARK